MLENFRIFLISLAEKEAEKMLKELNKLEIKSSIIGKVIKREEKDVIVK